MQTLDTSTMAWVSGLEYLNSIEPEFRKNLGPEHLLEETFAKYEQKTLFYDPETTRRMDLVRILPGHQDLTHCWHHSCEELFGLDGRVNVSGELSYGAGDYFWRPPGWVHKGLTDGGATFLLGFEGASPGDGSEAVDRIVADEADAGKNLFVAEDDPRAVGGRGRVLRVESSKLPWQPGDVYARAEGGSEAQLKSVAVKSLSKNWTTGAQTLVLQLAPGGDAGRGSFSAPIQAFILDGTVTIDGATLAAGTWFRFGGGEEHDFPTSPDGAMLYVKADGWFDWTIV